VVSQGPLLKKDYRRLDRGGVATLRFGIHWRSVQPQPDLWRWEKIDKVVLRASNAGVVLRPFMLGSPSWVASDPARPPLDSVAGRRAWRTFLTELVSRYGRGGAFWAARSRSSPIRRWQIWNEPNFPLYWQPRPSAREYARLLRISADAIRAVNPGARIVAAGVAPVSTGPWPWEFMRRLYSVRGVKRDFDTVALHPYARDLRGLRYQSRRVRRVMDRAGDSRTKLEITELGWASSGPRHHPAVKGRRGQARILGAAFRLLARKRRDWRLSGAQWFAWQDARRVEPSCHFCRGAGLFTIGRRPKPSWRAFKSASAARDG
jgi:polysaccharide biosynthesis protein PslG